MKTSFTAIYDTDSMKNIHYSFTTSSFADALNYCKVKLSVEIQNLLCTTKTRKQQFVKHKNTWVHLPYVGCSDGTIITDINKVELL
ncbi:MAG: hypothetical protein ACRCZB_04215 [Bacteroidales bacterium]